MITRNDERSVGDASSMKMTAGILTERRTVIKFINITECVT